MNLFSAPTVQYCEQPVEGIIRRPWYALSNLAYLGLGILLLTKKNDEIARRLGVLSLVIGLASLNYDTLFVWWAQLLDLLAMFVMIATLIYSSSIALRVDRKKVIGALSALVAVSMVLITLMGGYTGNLLFGLFVLAYTILEYFLFKNKLHKRYKYFGVALIAFTLGAAFWFLDTAGYYCLQMGLLNGRSIFHYLGAISVYLLYRFYSDQAK